MANSTAANPLMPYLITLKRSVQSVSVLNNSPNTSRIDWSAGSSASVSSNPKPCVLMPNSVSVSLKISDRAAKSSPILKVNSSRLAEPSLRSGIRSAPDLPNSATAAAAFCAPSGVSAKRSAICFSALSAGTIWPFESLTETPSALNFCARSALPSAALTRFTLSLVIPFPSVPTSTSASLAALPMPINVLTAIPVFACKLNSSSPASIDFLTIADKPPTMALPAIAAPKPATAPLNPVNAIEAFFTCPCNPCMELPKRRMLFSP